MFRNIFILSDIQENEVINYYIDDEILTIEITQQQPTINLGDPRLENEDDGQVKSSPAYKERRELSRTEKEENCTNSAGGKTQTEK